MINPKSKPIRPKAYATSIRGIFFWLFTAGTVVGAIFIGGVVCGLFLTRINFEERAIRKFSELTGLPNSKVFKLETLATSLNTLELIRFPTYPISRYGGSIAVVGTHILFLTQHGRLGFIRHGSRGVDYEIQYIDATVPMKYTELRNSTLATNKNFNILRFRTLDMLPLQRADGSFDLYVSYHRYAETCIEFVVSRVTIEATRDEIIIGDSNWEDVFVAEPCIEMKDIGSAFGGHESGGRLVKTSKNTLMVTVGHHAFDGVNSRKKVSIDSHTHLGKAVEIDLDTRKAIIFAVGLRNPQGLTVSSDGLIWETEHGPQGGDELNVLQRGGNYGWPEVTYGVNYGKREWPLNKAQGRHEGYTIPAYAFVPSIGISSLIETNSDEFPRWKGDLLVTSLKDQAIWRLRRDADRIIYGERIYIGATLRDIEELPNGRLVLLTGTGSIVIIRRKAVGKQEPARNDFTITVRGYGSSPKAFPKEQVIFRDKKDVDGPGGELFQAHCAGCHVVSGETIVGPPLAGVIGREIGSVQGFPYSDALTRSGGVWTKQRLINFLANPQENFKGTKMPKIYLPFGQYELVADYLNKAG